MNLSPIRLVSILLAVALLGVGGGYWFAHRQGSASANAQQGKMSAEKKALYWYDPMVPNQHFDKPGKSPYMDMQLIPKYANEDDQNANSIRIDPGIVQNLGVRFSIVEESSIGSSINAVGSIVFDQRLVAVVQSRANGFVSRVYARAPGDVLKQGAPLVDIVVPEWTAAQTEFIALLNSKDTSLADAARERLALLGMSDELIKEIESKRKPQSTMTVRTPIAGAIDSLEVREGMTISVGATLAKINGLKTVWVEAAVPESQSGMVTIGKSANVQLTALAGQMLKGPVIAILPEANAETRTLRVRIELKNPEGKLRPGMFSTVRFTMDAPQAALMVDSEAVIRSGTRNVVIVADEQGHFSPTEVEVGGDANGKTIILRGLHAGQKVVASGQFLIDSEANLKGVLTRLGMEREGKSESLTSTMHEGIGTIESIADDKIVISHGPIASLKWPAMTMGFKLQELHLAHELKVGDRVRFKFEQHANDFVITEVVRQGTQP